MNNTKIVGPITEVKENQKVLIIEDDQNLLILISKICRRIGYDVLQAESGNRAIELACENSDAMVLMDYSLPDMTGDELLERLKKLGIHPQFMVMTGRGDERLAVQMMKLGAMDYLVKDTNLLDMLPKALQWSFSEIRAKQAMKESEQFARSVLDGLSANIAVLDESGVIVAVNQAWKNFAVENDVELIKASEGINYIEVCEQAEGDFTEGAQEFAEGIRKVIDGRLQVYEAEYPCHSPEERRWFFGRVTPLHGETDGRAVVAHENITERKEAELALAKREHYFRSLLNSVMDEIVVIDPDLKILDVNDCFITRHNKTREELIGNQCKDIMEFCQLSQKEGRKCPAEECLQSGQPVISRFNIKDKEGNEQYLDIRVSPLYGDKRQVEQVIISIRDVSELVRAELMRSETEMLLHELAVNVEAVFWIWDLSLSNLIYVSEGYERIWGRSKNELDSDPESYLEYIHPDDKQALQAEVKQIASGASTSPLEIEYRITKPDGAEKWVLDRRFPIRDSSGRISRWGGLALDTTERRKSERDMSLLLTAIEQSPVEMIITDTNGKIEYVNPAFSDVTGYSRREVIGKSMSFLKSGAHDDSFYEDLWRNLKSGQVWTGRFVNRNSKGELFTEDATISPVRDAAGRIVNFVSTKWDITKQLQLEEQFRQSQKMEAVGQLAGGVAHDFNNILQATFGYISMLRRQIVENPQALGDLEEINKSSQRAAMLTKQLLAFSRQQVLEPRYMNLNDSLTDLMKMIRRMMLESVNLKYENLASEALIVHADPGQIGQVVLNLCVNARDSMPEGGLLRITLRDRVFDREECKELTWAVPGPYACVSVEDTGRGIPEDILQYIFQPFFTTKKEGEGTGLGLSTCYGIIKQHEGFLHVESEIEKGSIFEFYLPLVRRGATADGEQGEQQAPPGGTETLLLAEDDANVRKITRSMLREAGYTVLLAKDGLEAVQIVREKAGEIDLAVLDVIMPKLSGHKVRDVLARSSPETRALFVSGYNPEVVERKFTLREGDKLLQKPCSPDELLRRIRSMLDEED